MNIQGEKTIFQYSHSCNTTILSLIVQLLCKHNLKPSYPVTELNYNCTLKGRTCQRKKIVYIYNTEFLPKCN